MDKYESANKWLAELLGCCYTPGGQLGGRGSWSNGRKGNKFSFVSQLPDWTGDDAASFGLMVDYGCFPHMVCEQEQGIWFVSMGGTGRPWHLTETHSSKDAAIRYAIVMAVISLLEQKINQGVRL